MDVMVNEQEEDTGWQGAWYSLGTKDRRSIIDHKSTTQINKTD